MEHTWTAIEIKWNGAWILITSMQWRAGSLGIKIMRQSGRSFWLSCRQIHCIATLSITLDDPSNNITLRSPSGLCGILMGLHLSRVSHFLGQFFKWQRQRQGQTYTAPIPHTHHHNGQATHHKRARNMGWAATRLNRVARTHCCREQHTLLRVLCIQIYLHI